MIRVPHLVTLAALLGSSLVYAAEPVDINTASAEMLAEAINGVGMKKAQAIVAHREQHGPFESVDELSRVSGIGDRMVEKSRANLRVGAGSE